MRLRLTTAAHMGTTENSITPYDYLHTKFIVAQSFEKAPGVASHSGINTRSGSMLTLNFKNLGLVTSIYVTLIFDAICNISMAGAEVLD